MRNNILSLTFGLRSQPRSSSVNRVTSSKLLLTPRCQSTLDPISDIIQIIFNFHSVQYTHQHLRKAHPDLVYSKQILPHFCITDASDPIVSLSHSCMRKTVILGGQGNFYPQLLEIDRMFNHFKNHCFPSRIGSILMLPIRKC